MGEAIHADASDVYKTIQGVPPRFRGNATWMADLSTLNAIDQMETANLAGAYLALWG